MNHRAREWYKSNVTDAVFEMIDSLRKGTSVSDTQFDKIFPLELRRQTRVHWTEVPVAIKAIELLCGDSPNSRILDVGSNVGKFCIIGSLVCQAHFVGIEIRRDLVEHARRIVRDLHIERVSYKCIDMEFFDWSAFSGIYLFNPFYEHLQKEIRLDRTMNYSESQFKKYVEITRQKLSLCVPGTRVVTYHGFGGDFPPGFVRQESPLTENSRLELWIKT